MTIEFKNITEARSYLTSTGYVSVGRCLFGKGEAYEAGSLLAILRAIPFKGYRITIR